MKTVSLALGVALAAFAGQADAKQLCCGAKVAMTFGDAAPEVKLLVLVLWMAAAASLVVWALALRRLARTPGDTLPRTLAFLQAWRAAGPPLAVGMSGYVMLNFFVAVYAYAPVARYQQYAPGLAEVAMIVWAGFQAAGVAALAAEHLKGRLLVRA